MLFLYYYYFPFKHYLVFQGLPFSFRVNILKISFKRKKFFIQQRQKHVSSHFTFFLSNCIQIFAF